MQKTGTGVQEKIEEALAKLFPSRPRLHSSSRTDTGVHALGMVAHFEAPKGEWRPSSRKLALALNAWLPQDIRIISATRTAETFHARFDAVGKQYRYRVWNHSAMNPLLRNSAWHVPRRLDVRTMRDATRHFIGKHDFRAFTANTRYDKGSTVRKLTRCDIRQQGPLLTFIIEGDGFLYKMCRGLVGTLVQAGQGKFAADETKKMLAKKDRRLAGMTAPAQGLVLWKVFYKRQRAAFRPTRLTSRTGQTSRTEH